ncbi:MAG: hypothetical protein Q8K92_09315 [Leadbetterella sp.]|nr:hypothetical protein [Leadbetterella sp.]
MVSMLLAQALIVMSIQWIGFSLFSKNSIQPENANKILKGPIRLRPIFLHKQERIESFSLVIFLALMAYYLLERTYCYHQKEEQKKKGKKDNKVIKKLTLRENFFLISAGIALVLYILGIRRY